MESFEIVPIFKKGNKNEIENYCPIANLFSASKVFEKLILKQIHYLEATNKLDLTGKRQGAVALWSNAAALDRKTGGSKLAANSYFERTTKTREKD